MYYFNENNIICYCNDKGILESTNNPDGVVPVKVVSKSISNKNSSHIGLCVDESGILYKLTTSLLLGNIFYSSNDPRKLKPNRLSGTIIYEFMAKLVYQKYIDIFCFDDRFFVIDDKYNLYYLNSHFEPRKICNVQNMKKIKYIIYYQNNTTFIYYDDKLRIVPRYNIYLFNLVYNNVVNVKLYNEYFEVKNKEKIYSENYRTFDDIYTIIYLTIFLMLLMLFMIGLSIFINFDSYGLFQNISWTLNFIASCLIILSIVRFIMNCTVKNTNQYLIYDSDADTESDIITFCSNDKKFSCTGRSEKINTQNIKSAKNY